MFKTIHPRDREMFGLLAELAKALRFCQQDQAFCEGVTFSQFIILDLTAQAGRLGLADLHGYLGVEKSTTTRLIRPLVDRGLAARKRSARDSRAVVLQLTEAGAAVHASVWDCLGRFMDLVTANLAPADRAGTLAAVFRFVEAIKAACAPGRPPDQNCCQIGQPARPGQEG